jgi:hypothetical protein
MAARSGTELSLSVPPIVAQYSSASRFTAGAFGFLTFTQRDAWVTSPARIPKSRLLNSKAPEMVALAALAPPQGPREPMLLASLAGV